jgi:hypothetical protein
MSRSLVVVAAAIAVRFLDFVGVDPLVRCHRSKGLGRLGEERPSGLQGVVAVAAVSSFRICDLRDRPLASGDEGVAALRIRDGGVTGG